MCKSVIYWDDCNTPGWLSCIMGEHKNHSYKPLEVKYHEIAEENKERKKNYLKVIQKNSELFENLTEFRETLTDLSNIGHYPLKIDNAPWKLPYLESKYQAIIHFVDRFLKSKSIGINLFKKYA